MWFLELIKQVGGGLLLIAGFVTLLYVLGRLRVALKKFLRKQVTREDYFDHFLDENIDNKVLLEVYNYLSNWMSPRDFPVLPSDRLDKV